MKIMAYLTPSCMCCYATHISIDIINLLFLNTVEMPLRINRCFQRLKLTHQNETKFYHNQNLDIPYLNLHVPQCFPSQKMTPFSFSGQKQVSSSLTSFPHTLYSIFNAQQILQNLPRSFYFLPPQQSHASPSCHPLSSKLIY